MRFFEIISGKRPLLECKGELFVKATYGVISRPGEPGPISLATFSQQGEIHSNMTPLPTSCARHRVVPVI